MSAINEAENFVQNLIKLVTDIDTDVTSKVDPRGVTCYVTAIDDLNTPKILGSRGVNADAFRRMAHIWAKRHNIHLSIFVKSKAYKNNLEQ